jgi:hypothetical protein
MFSIATMIWSVERMKMRHILIWLSTATFSAACSQADDRTASSTSHVAHTICLDRLLIDVPADVEISGSRLKYRGGIGFPGIEKVAGVRGVGSTVWRGVTIDETLPGDEAGFLNVRDGATGQATRAKNMNNDALSGARRDIGRHQEQVARAKSAEDRKLAQERLDNDRRDLAQYKKDQANTGDAHLGQPYAFAFRRDDGSIVGYFDPADHRVRVFDGPLEHPEIPGPHAAGAEFERWQRIYHRREPTEIPSTSGYCTGHGFVDEPDGPQPSHFELAFRSLKYPNLLFTLYISSAGDATEPKQNIQKLPDMNIDQSSTVSFVAAKRTIGPKPITMLGTPGRWFAAIQNAGCKDGKCWGEDSAYDIEAVTLGEPGRADRPRMTLLMRAAMPTARRPGLEGKEPPPFKEGESVFNQVLQSIRLRPGAIAGHP